MITTWSPVLRCGVKVGLCLPRRILATELARRPSTWSVASTTNQSLLRSAVFAVQVFCLLKRFLSKSLPSVSGPLRGPFLPPTADLALVILDPPIRAAAVLGPPQPALRRCCGPGLGGNLLPPAPAPRNLLAAPLSRSASRAPGRRVARRRSSSWSSRACRQALSPRRTSRRRPADRPPARTGPVRERGWPCGPGSGSGSASNARSTERGNHPGPPRRSVRPHRRAAWHSAPPPIAVV